MKIAFICGSLENGKDGVGDYTRQLASELIKNKDSILLIALNDPFQKDIFSEVQRLGDNQIEILRIPRTLKEIERVVRAKEYIQTFKPDWISLQFVPYSFQEKGLPFSFPKAIKELGDFRWHIMFHELWIDKPEKMSHRLFSFLQKQIIKKVVSVLRPSLIHVSIPFNQQRLKQIHIQSQLLELFGNVPYEANPDAANLSLPKSQNNTLLYFGSAPKGTYLEMVVTGINDFYKKSGKPIHLILISSESESKQTFIRRLKEVLTPIHGTITDCGFVETNILSGIMSCCTAGIARSEPHLLGKSGTAIAMLEHGLPIWLPKWKEAETTLPYSFRSELVYSNLTSAMSAVHQGYCSKLGDVTNQFISQLNNH